jgi:hypothetical protein
MGTTPIEEEFRIPIINNDWDLSIELAEDFLNSVYSETQSLCPIGRPRPNHAPGTLKRSWFGDYDLDTDGVLIRYGYGEVYASYIDDMTGFFSVGESIAKNQTEAKIENARDRILEQIEEIERNLAIFEELF